MPIMRRDLWGSSVMRKWLAFSASRSAGIFQERFGARTVRVLIVTTGPARVAAMVEAFEALGIASDGWITRIEPDGAKLEPQP